MATADTLGARLRQARERAGFNQQDAAAATGIAREVISYWENGRRVPGLAQLTRLADTYGIAVASLADEAQALETTTERTIFHRGLTTQSPHTRGTVQRWLTFLDNWAELREECGESLPGPGSAPVGAWRQPHPITDSRRAPTLASEVRRHYQLGLEAIPDLFAFLDQHGVLVCRAPLGPIAADSGISGLFYNHPRLGFSILVNSETTPGRQVFTLAHELAHAFFHYQETGLVSRAGTNDRKESFADAFAGHLLVPGEALHALVRKGPDSLIRDPYEVVRLQRYFRVSYATALYRLRGEGLLSAEQYAEYRDYSPADLTARLGLEVDEYRHPRQAAGLTLGAYPASVLEQIRTLIQAEELSPAAAASLLSVPQEAILEELLAAPEPADIDERREFAELPAPAQPRRPRATVSA